MKEKLTSRKFLLGLAAFLASLGAGITGIVTDNQVLAVVGAVCCVVSAAIYEALEATVDKAAATRLVVALEPDCKLNDIQFANGHCKSVELEITDVGGTDDGEE